MKQTNNQNKNQFENTILKNTKNDYKSFLKLTNKKDIVKFVNGLETKTILNNNEITTILLLDKNKIDFIKNIINVDITKISNNQLKEILNNSYKSAFTNGLQTIDKTKDEIIYKNDNTLKVYHFYKTLILQCYFYDKTIIKNRLTGNFETKNK